MVLLPLSDSVQRAGEMEPQCGCGLGFWSQSAKVICFNIACPQNHSTVLEISPCHLKKPTEHTATSIILLTLTLILNMHVNWETKVILFQSVFSMAGKMFQSY